METQNPPAYVTELQSVYGDESQTIGNGSAVYFQVFTSEDLEKINDSLKSTATSCLRQYASSLWDREQDDGSICPGEEVWGINLIYQRPSNDTGIVDEINQLLDQYFPTIVPVVDFFREEQLYTDVMHRAFDDPSVTLLQYYQVIDSGVFDGLLVAACRANGEVVVWIFLQD
jgi:hypothetical protein